MNASYRSGHARHNQKQPIRWDCGLRHADHLRSRGRGTQDIGVVRVVARRSHHDHAHADCIGAGFAQIVLPLAVWISKRQVDDIHRIGDIAIAVGIEGKVHCLEQGHATARVRDRAADLERK